MDRSKMNSIGRSKNFCAFCCCRHRGLTLRNHGANGEKKVTSSSHKQLQEEIDKVQMKLAWISSRTKLGDFRPENQVALATKDLASWADNTKQQWEKWDGRILDSVQF